MLRDIDIDTLFELRRRYVPYKSEKGKVCNQPRSAENIKEKRRLHRKWIRSISTPAEERSRTEYVTAQNLVNRKITQTKRS